MIYLLDTCVLLWAIGDNKNKIKDFLPILEDPSTEILVSVVSYWEITIKNSLGKLEVPDDLPVLVEQSGFTWLNLEIRHIDNLKNLPSIHNDPFDRLLIAQSQCDNLKLLTVDQTILKYFN